MNDWKITFGLPKPEKDPASIDEMRQAIDRARWDSSLIKNALDTAQFNGMSGEDKYAMLAYWALRELETQYQSNLRWLMLQPSPGIIRQPDEVSAHR
jgi:hypothetical protein